jgi:hypothetical protein
MDDGSVENAGAFFDPFILNIKKALQLRTEVLKAN